MIKHTDDRRKIRLTGWTRGGFLRTYEFEIHGETKHAGTLLLRKGRIWHWYQEVGQISRVNAIRRRVILLDGVHEENN